MRLLISANSFHPVVGGYEGVARLVVEQLRARGMTVRVITFTSAEGGEELPYEVYRNPGALKLLELVRWSDIYIQNNVSLKLLWPMLLVRRPLLFIHHGFYKIPGDRRFSWQSWLKLVATHWGGNLAVSTAVAESIPAVAQVCLNPYRDDVFYRMPAIAKNRDLIFVGRLVSDKGADLLIEALAALHARGWAVSLAIAGSGPEESALKNQVRELGLAKSVTFEGRVIGEKLGELLNAHKVMVVPTRTVEGFGVVALEGIACGCVLVGASDGGLKEAIGPCGRIFPKGDARALAETLEDLLRKPGEWQRYFASAESHLEMHRPAAVADRYVRAIEQLAGAVRA